MTRTAKCSWLERIANLSQSGHIVNCLQCGLRFTDSDCPIWKKHEDSVLKMYSNWAWDKYVYTQPFFSMTVVTVHTLSGTQLQIKLAANTSIWCFKGAIKRLWDGNSHTVESTTKIFVYVGMKAWSSAQGAMMQCVAQGSVKEMIGSIIEAFVGQL
mgnify:CR=1 FL=1